MDTVLITGAHGFVGSHLSDFLLSKGHHVYGTFLEGFSLDNLTRAISNDISLVSMDITNSSQVSQQLQRIRPDYVFHLAAQTSTPESFQDPLTTFKVNVGGTVNLLESLRILKERNEHNPWVYVVLSQEAFGQLHADEIPIDEDQPYRPTSPYGISKAVIHQISEQYVTKYGLNVVLLRPFTHSGPRQKLGFLFPDWASQIAAIEAGMQEPVIKVGNLEAVRDYLHAKDVVRAYAMAIGKGEPGEIYNICSGVETPVQDVLDEMIRQSIYQGRVEVEQDPERMRPSDTPLFVGTYKKFHDLTGWNPELGLADIVADVLAYWRNKVDHQP